MLEGFFSVLQGKLMTVLVVHLHATAIPNSAHRVCDQENATVLRFCCHMWLKQFLTLLGNFTSTYTSWILCIDFFFLDRENILLFVQVFSKFICCKMLLWIFLFSKAGINGKLHECSCLLLFLLLAEHISREWLLQDDLTGKICVPLRLW